MLASFPEVTRLVCFAKCVILKSSGVAQVKGGGELNSSQKETMLEHTTMEVNSVALHVVQAGPQDGPLVILLHGFPEFWYG